MPSPSDDEIRRRYGLPPGTRIVRLTPDALGRVRVTPDAFAYVEVESALEWAGWDRPTVVAGATARLAVETVFVGEGTAEIPPARVDVALHDARDRVVGRGSGTVSRDRATVEVAVDREASGLCAADVEIKDLGLKTVSPSLTVLPYAALDRARWGQAEARDGDAVGLSCRVTGSAAGVERLEGQTAEVEVLRGEEGGEGRTGGAADALFEPVVTLRVPVRDGRVEAAWRVGYDAEGKARIATQPELDAVAERTGAEAGRYRRPVWRFRVRVAGLEAESGELGYQDWVEVELVSPDGTPVLDEPYVVHLADGTTREGTLGADGRAREEDVPPGPVLAEYPDHEDLL